MTAVRLRHASGHTPTDDMNLRFLGGSAHTRTARPPSSHEAVALRRHHSTRVRRFYWRTNAIVQPLMEGRIGAGDEHAHVPRPLRHDAGRDVRSYLQPTHGPPPPRDSSADNAGQDGGRSRITTDPAPETFESRALLHFLGNTHPHIPPKELCPQTQASRSKARSGSPLASLQSSLCFLP